MCADFRRTRRGLAPFGNVIGARANPWPGTGRSRHDALRTVKERCVNDHDGSPRLASRRHCGYGVPSFLLETTHAQVD